MHGRDVDCRFVSFSIKCTRGIFGADELAFAHQCEDVGPVEKGDVFLKIMFSDFINFEKNLHVDNGCMYVCLTSET
jgi:hypothetical protein